MKIDNATRYDTRDLARLIRAVAHRGELDPLPLRLLRVRVIYGRRRREGLVCCRGRAWIGKPRFILWVDKDHEAMRRDISLLAFVIAHEMAHCRGMRHRQMATPRYKWSFVDSEPLYAWARDYPLGVKQERPSQVPTVDAKLHHACIMLAKWKARIHRDQAYLSRWLRRVTYYERKVAMAAVSWGEKRKGDSNDVALHDPCPGQVKREEMERTTETRRW